MSVDIADANPQHIATASVIGLQLLQVTAPAPAAFPAFTAQNAKVVLLTGTPIINYPNEIAVLFNILQGVIKNWWSKEDTATYERKIAAIRRQYEEISRRDGFVIDGNLSLSENLADVTGIAVCEDALNKFHYDVYDGVVDINNNNDNIRAISFLNFYTYYAIQSRQYANFREILVQVLTNPHLNLKIRTNVPLMRSKTFREVVEIKKSDKMYNDDFDVVF